MGSAIARGLIATVPGFLEAPADLSVANPSPGKLDPLARSGAYTTSSDTEAVRGASLVILCVKPWLVEQVISEIKDHIDYSSAEIAVVAAQVSISDLRTWLHKDSAPALPSFCIAMPNTAVSTLRSMTFIVNGNGRCPLATQAFSLLGEAMEIEEKLLPAATSLASCGIAYAMRYIRAAVEGGVELGVRPQLAQKMVLQTLIGAASLLSSPGSHPESEIDKVTTPGGLTIRGLNAMEHSGFTSAVINGLKASTTQ